MSDFNLDQGTEREYLLNALSQFVATQEQIANSLMQISATNQALASQKLTDYEPNYKRHISEYEDFNWSDINATVVSRDSDGFVDVVECLGYRWIRRCSPNNHKFGNTIRFNRAKKEDGEEIKWLDLIKFGDKETEIDPLSNVVLALIKKSRKNNDSRPAYNGNKQTTALPPGTQQPIAIPTNSNSRPNVSYPLQPSSRPAPQPDTANPLKVQRQKELRQLIGTNKIPVEDVVAISLAKYGVRSSDDMNVQQIEELYQHLSVEYSVNAVTVPVPEQ